MPELVLLIVLSVVALFLLGRATATGGDSSTGPLRTVSRGGRALTRLGASYRPVEHLRH